MHVVDLLQVAANICPCHTFVQLSKQSNLIATERGGHKRAPTSCAKNSSKPSGAADYGRRAARPGLALRRQSDPPSDWRRRACPIFFNLSFIT